MYKVLVSFYTLQVLTEVEVVELVIVLVVIVAVVVGAVVGELPGVEVVVTLRLGHKVTNE